VLEVLLLDRVAVDGCDGVAWYAATSDGNRSGGGEGAQGQEKSSNLDHERSFGRGDGNTESAARCALRLGHGALLG
jgi:hypothetical protein